jgi:hypothetical protein
MVVIAVCTGAEIYAAYTAPEIAAQQREGVVLARQAQDIGKAEKPAEATIDAREGKVGKLTREQNAGKALDLLGGRDAEAKTIREKERENAVKTIAGEGVLTILLSILGSIGSARAMPLTRKYIRARRQAQEA